ncbi:hypothetical protein ScPMuIL_007954 [Solemya velum]
MNIEAFIPESIKRLPTHMDFEGQKKAEKTFQIIILLFGIVGFVWGYICQQFSQTMYILLAGFFVSCLLTLPPWSMYRKKSLPWQKARAVSDVDTPSTTPTPTPSGSQKSKKKK